ncbi:uncharacterized protein LOC105023760 [Esox lucius]|uniref:uncharacterized protein LOC105023760 n=1 Tax=Esox lucius TaxID=8010 RepID=UPI0014769DB3|nr:uncharacterized protein LOC105023760 [Esox lucius]XP_019906975.3 uncharacterized protein LOC105023760 [Esox lucius]XP_034151603.1 uncharacterized protein LOC105023760 [Esox lucius]
MLVALSSHRETHPDLIRSLPSYCSLLQTQPLGSRQLRLVTKLLFKLSENSTLLEILLNCRADRWLMSMLRPSSPRETLLHCLGLLSNLSHHEPPGDAIGPQYNEASMYALLYSRPTPLPQALRPLAQHSDPRVSASAGHMLSRLTLPRPPPQRSWASSPAWQPRSVLHTSPLAPRRLWPDSPILPSRLRPDSPILPSRLRPDSQL